MGSFAKAIKSLCTNAEERNKLAENAKRYDKSPIMGRKIKRMAKFIIISGVDGAEDYLIEGVRKALEVDGKKVGYIWMRYNFKLTTVMHAFAKMAGLAYKENTPMGVKWLHRFYESKLFCWAYIHAYYIDTLGKSKPVKLAEKERLDYVICDRWVNDIIIDLGSENTIWIYWKQVV